MSALDMIAGGGPPPMAGPDAPVPGGPAPDPGQPGGNADAQAAEILGQALDLLNAYMGVEPDEEDKSVVATCIAQIQKVRAKDQQDADKMMSGNVTPRALRSALGA